MQVRKLIKLLVVMTLAAGLWRALACKARSEPAPRPRVIQMTVSQRGFEPP